MKKITSGLFFIALALITTTGNAQIFQPEGVNIPGSWNGFTNSNDEGVMGNFRTSYRALGGGQYITTLNIQATGGDASGGTYTMLFTSGPDANTFANKWADATLNIDGFTSLTYNSGADNSITVQDGFFYTFLFKDNGYAASEAVVLKTSSTPVEITNVTGIPDTSVTENAGVTISVQLSDVKSSEEKIFIRYSTDGFATSSAVEVTNFAGTTSGSATIPGQPKNSKVNFYVLSTTLDETNWNNKIDLATLNFNNNSGENYSYFYEANILPVHQSTGVDLTPDFRWFSLDGATGYDFQLSETDDFATTVVNETNLTDTTYSVSTDLSINTTYYWRFKDASGSTWSDTYSFTTESAVTFANLQFPAEQVIDEGSDFTAFGQVTVPGRTSESGADDSIKVWLGLNTENTDPSTWAEGTWKIADYNEDKVSTDEYSAQSGSSLSPGKYYFTFRYQYKDQDLVYGGTDSFWNGTTSISGQLEVLEVPELVSPVNNATGVALEAVLDWNSNDTAIQGFQVQVDDEATFGSPVLDESGLSNASTEYTISTGVLENATKYFWRVRAEYDTTASGWSETLAFTTEVGAPGTSMTLVPIDGSSEVSTMPDFKWNTAVNANEYELQISTVNDFSSISLTKSSITDTTITLENSEILDAATNYYWRVRAVNGSGNGAWSDTSSFKTEIKVPELLSPAEDATNVNTEPKLVWRSISGVITYQIQIAESSSFASTLTDSNSVTDTLIIAPKLENSTDYYWRVRANYSADTSAWSTSRLFTTKSPAPLPPQLLNPENEALDIALEPQLSWTSVSDADFYELQLSGDESFTSEIIIDSTNITNESIMSPALLRDKEYFWRVRSVNNSTGTGSWSGINSFTTIPEIPENFTAIAPVNNAVNQPDPVMFVWNKSEGASSYRFQFAETSEFIFKSDTLVADTSIQISGLESDQTYFWRVRAENSAGNSEWTTVLKFTTGISGFEGPKLLLPENDAINQPAEIDFSWDTLSGATFYRIQISESQVFSAFHEDSSGITNTSVNFSGFEKQKTYYWRVSAETDNGMSDWSSVYSFSTEPQDASVPVLVSPLNGADSLETSVQFSWNEVGNADSYEIRVSKTSDFLISTDSAGISDTLITLKNFSFDQQYFWQVRAVNGSGKSSWSSLFSFKTKSQLPGIPELINPEPESEVSIPVRLGWNSADRAVSYHVQVYRTDVFSEMLVDSSGVKANALSVNNLAENVSYSWRVRGENGAGFGEWSEEAIFTTVVLTSSEREGIPEEFALHQNYPNPFNPSTTISYDLKHSGKITLTVFDISGRLVQEIVNGNKPAGKHTIQFNASDLASGIYFVRLETIGFVDVIKMTLIK